MFGNVPVPFPDENSYSLLCRYSVRRGQLTSSQLCIELFGHTQPLSGYVFKPFKIKDLEKWYSGEVPEGLEFGSRHSCYPYYAMFLGPVHAERVRACRIGSSMTAGQAKRINRECGFARSHKKNLWYCPECVREDFAWKGETCWRRLPQMPGAIYCPIHEVRFRESDVCFEDIDYQLIPATYALLHLPERDMGNANVYSDRYFLLSKDIAWLLENGFMVADNEGVRRSFIEASGKPVREHLFCRAAKAQSRENRFEDYLAGRIMTDSGKSRIARQISRQLGTILSIEESYGSLEAFYGA